MKNMMRFPREIKKVMEKKRGKKLLEFNPISYKKHAS